MKTIAISACLLGQSTRYDGQAKRNDKLLELISDNLLIHICPEVLGGLKIPRYPAEKKDGKWINSIGEDVTENYLEGSKKALEFIKENKVDFVILKTKSPACGLNEIYDGTFTKTFVKDNGCFAELCLKEGYQVFTQHDLEEIKKVL